MINRVYALSRFELENRFFIREPFALISYRYPGARFVTLPLADLCVGTSNLMFHDIDRKTDKHHGQMLMPGRQATKIVSFVKSIECSILICQCETGLSVAPAIAAPICTWLGAEHIKAGTPITPNSHVQTMVEMAIEWDAFTQSL